MEDSSAPSGQVSKEDPEFNVDFEVNVSPDHKEAVISLKSEEPMSSEELVYVLELWIDDMKKHFGETDAARTDPT